MSKTAQRVSSRRWNIAQRVERVWWRRYLSRRDPVSYLTWKRDYWNSFLEAIGLSPKPGSKVLDAGCGPAGIFCALPDCDIVAVDPLLDTYESLPHFHEAKHTRVQFVESTLEAFAAQAKFDYVFCLNVINHVRDLNEVCEVLAKAVKSGGTVVISVDAHRYPWLKPIFKHVPGDVLHPHQMVLDEYHTHIGATGLQRANQLLYKREFLFDYWVLTYTKPQVA